MQTQQINKIKGLVNISNKAGYVIIGADNLKKYNKKLYLILYSNDSGKTIQKVITNKKTLTNCEIIEIDAQEFSKIVSIDDCKIVGFKNLGLSKEIIKVIRGE